MGGNGNGGPRAGRTVILLVEDDEDDYVLTRDALAACKLDTDLRWVRDGQEALEYLRREGAHDEETAPRPALILLDLNMPRLSGRDVLKEIKADAALRSIPIIVLTTSQTAEDIARSYDLGVNSFIQKPLDFTTFINVIRQVTEYWFEIVKLPR